MTPLHEFLKRETRALHTRAEQAFARFDLSQPGGYGEFLQAQASALLPLEAELEAQGAAALLDDWPARRRSAAILADLATLELLPVDPQPAPRLGNAERVLGALYVMEGSKLGARYLLARITGDAARGATQFLSHGRGAGAESSWPNFLARLDAAIPDDPTGRHAAETLAGAVGAFALFENAALCFAKA